MRIEITANQRKLLEQTLTLAAQASSEAQAAGKRAEALQAVSSAIATTIALDAGQGSVPEGAEMQLLPPDAAGKYFLQFVTVTHLPPPPPEVMAKAAAAKKK